MINFAAMLGSYDQYILIFLILVFVIKLAVRYSSAKLEKNTKINEKITSGKNKNYELVKDLNLKFFCQTVKEQKMLVIKKGSIVRANKKNFIVLLNGILVPVGIEYKFGTEYMNEYVIKRKKKYLIESRLLPHMVYFEIVSAPHKEKQLVFS
jgi:hypothetical protein